MARGGVASIVKFAKKTEFFAYRGRTWLLVQRGAAPKSGRPDQRVTIEITGRSVMVEQDGGRTTVQLTRAEVKRLHRYFRQVLDQKAEGIAEHVADAEIDQLPHNIEGIVRTRFQSRIGRKKGAALYLREVGERVVLSERP